MKLTLLFATASVSIVGWARPVYMNTLKSQVPGGLVETKCNTCHLPNSKALNLFGKDFAGIFRAPNESLFPGVSQMTSEEKWDLLMNKLDSNGNDISNLEDILNKVNPGLKVE